MKRVLILEPYYGGSHKHFLEGLQRWLGADFLLFSLPARKWKMRMQFSAVCFVQKIGALPEKQRRFDVVLCSTFVDVAVLRALLLDVSGWNQKALVKTYFHENQFAYPNQVDDISMRHFTAINYTTALASDEIAFNSHYNFNSFCAAVKKVLTLTSDMDVGQSLDRIREKSRVLYPGMDYSSIDRVQKPPLVNATPVIVWNHRWEHDKGPEEFFQALYCLQEKKIAFKLIVLGESYATIPDCFVEVKSRLADEILHFGYVQSRHEYVKLLCQGDIVVSTATHEFFGISVLEAVRAGCYPLLPRSLSYPELFPDAYMYARGKLAKRLVQFLSHPKQLSKKEVESLTEQYGWPVLQSEYAQWLL